MLIKGTTGQVEVFEDRIVIHRKGLFAFTQHGLKGEKSIPFAGIAAVQFKDAGILDGYIQFSLIGGVESTKGFWKAHQDENTVVFKKSQRAEFRKLRDAVNAKLSNQQASRSSLPASTSTADELAKLAKLRMDGSLSEREFQLLKDKLVGA